MADENIDDDLFADLYDNDEEPAPPPVVTKAEPEPEEVPGKAEPITQQEIPVTNYQETPSYNNNDMSMNDYDAQNHGGGMNNGGYGGDNNMGYGAPEDPHEPIGMKEDGKMFIGGLNWETTDQSLKDYFEQFGEVLECTVMRDGATGRSRGFGFLTFKDPKTVNIVMVKEHHLDGKIIDPKRAIPREEQERTAKIFVGGVSQDCTEQYFKEFFMRYGRVIDATLMMDKDTGRPRGFGFVTFDGEDAVDRTLQQPLAIHGKPIEVKRAEPRGNVHDDKGGKFGKGRGRGDHGGQFDGNQDQFQGGAQAVGPSGGNTNGMSQAQMAAYWFKMQEYFRNMQQMMAGGMAPQAQMPAMMGGMNPAMMQQMMMAQGGGQQRMMSPGDTTPMGPNGPMSPGMQNQMMMAAQGQGGGGAGGGSQSGGNYGGQMMGQDPSGGRPSFTPQDQMAFEQQKYEKQQMARMQQHQYASQHGGYNQGGPTSWEGMYDDVPPPNAIPAGPAGRGGFGGRGGRRGADRQMSSGRSDGGGGPAASAPLNAPTGPKNAGKPGANYRGGGRGGGRPGFRPY